MIYIITAYHMGCICPNKVAHEEATENNETTLINKLENDGYTKLKMIRNTTRISPNDDLQNNPFLKIIKEGAAECEEKTGRTMSYAEMRYAYG